MSLEEIRQGRIDKIDEVWRAAGVHPYPERFARTHTIAEAFELPEGTEKVSICGRLMRINKMGKLTFCVLADINGRMQIALQKTVLGEEDYLRLRGKLDVGDFLGVIGTVKPTKKNEPTVWADEVVFLGKSLLPLPDKHAGISETEDGREMRYRKRYLDLLTDESTRARFLLRSRVVQSLRRQLEDSGFIEVDTPVLCNQPSGALAKPFFSHHNALDMQVALRIAPETYLKRCIVGGFDRVFEFARCFRNEGIDASHLQDFTMLEYYAAYWNHEDNMDFTESLVRGVVEAVHPEGKPEITRGGRTISFAGPWPRLSFRELILRDAEIDISAFEDADALRAEIKAKGITIEAPKFEQLGLGNLIDALYKKVSRPKLVEPCFLTGHPISLSPLARRNDEDPEIADRWQLVVDGWEVVNAYSELVDPIDQLGRLEAQAAAREGGDDEAMPLDRDYIEAMEVGMPPMSGWGMGIDRFVALLADAPNLKDVVLFPLMRPLPAGDECEDEGAEDYR